jgi:photosystem II stability/assembly factor-like uncharacterized protein
VRAPAIIVALILFVQFEGCKKESATSPIIPPTETWTQVAALGTSFVASLAVEGSTIFVGTMGNAAYRSTNSGVSWVHLDSALTNTYSIAVRGQSVLQAYGNISMSTDNGTTWQDITLKLLAGNQFLKLVVVNVAFFGTQMFVGMDEDGVYRSSNGGDSWSSFVSGINPFSNIFVYGNNKLFLLANTWKSHGTIYPCNIYLISDDTTRWVPVGSPPPDTSYYWCIAVQGTSMFLGTDVNGVYRSTNGGTNWLTSSPGLEGKRVTALAVSDSVVYAGLAPGGVYYSRNNGQQWTTMDTSLSSLYVNSLAICGSALFAGTSSGFWRHSL